MNILTEGNYSMNLPANSIQESQPARELSLPRLVELNICKLDFFDMTIIVFVEENYGLLSIATFLGVTQPAISKRLRKMEKIFGEKIFVKRGRQLTLTDRGKEIVKVGYRILDLADKVHPKESMPLRECH